MNNEQETQNYLQSVLELEGILEGECLCESPHIDTASTHCDILATYRVTIKCQKRSGMICASLAHANADHMMYQNTFCIECGREAFECWVITPL